MREAFGCLWAVRARQTVVRAARTIRRRRELRRAVSAVAKQRLAALCDTRESWSMQRLCAACSGKTQRRRESGLIPLVFLYSS